LSGGGPHLLPAAGGSCSNLTGNPTANQQEAQQMAKFKVDNSARYAMTHEWVRMEDGIATIGISDYAQDALSDVVFVDLPEVGELVSAGQPVATVESVKAAEDVISPVSGEVIEVNSALEATPEMVNERPYEAWFYRVKPTAAVDAELAALLSAADYDKLMDEAADAH
jgi:glycine cleavage system H protein